MQGETKARVQPSNTKTAQSTRTHLQQQGRDGPATHRGVLHIHHLGDGGRQLTTATAQQHSSTAAQQHSSTAAQQHSSTAAQQYKPTNQINDNEGKGR
jgi:hypothetical protein